MHPFFSLIASLFILGDTTAASGTKIAALTEVFDQKDLALLLGDTTNPPKDVVTLQAEEAVKAGELDISAVEKLPCGYAMNQAMIMTFKHGLKYGAEPSSAAGKAGRKRLSLATRMALRCAKGLMEESKLVTGKGGKDQSLVSVVGDHYEHYQEQLEAMKTMGFLKQSPLTITPPDHLPQPIPRIKSNDVPPRPVPQSPSPPPRRAQSAVAFTRSSTVSEQNEPEIERMLDLEDFDNFKDSPHPSRHEEEHLEASPPHIPEHKIPSQPKPSASPPSPQPSVPESANNGKPSGADGDGEVDIPISVDDESGSADRSGDHASSMNRSKRTKSSWSFLGSIKSWWSGFVGFFSRKK